MPSESHDRTMRWVSGRRSGAIKAHLAASRATGRVGVERRAQPAHRMVKSGSDGSDGDAEDVGDLVEGEVEVVMEDDHRPVVEGESAEGPLELIAIDDRLELALRGRIDIRQHVDDGPPERVRRPSA